MKFRDKAVLPSLSFIYFILLFFFFGFFCRDCQFVFEALQSHKLSKRDYRMEFSVKHCKKSLDFAPAGDDASLNESGNSDRGSSSSSYFSEKLGDDDHVVRLDEKEILRRKLQEKTVRVN